MRRRVASGGNGGALDEDGGDHHDDHDGHDLAQARRRRVEAFDVPAVAGPDVAEEDAESNCRLISFELFGRFASVIETRRGSTGMLST